MAAVARHSWPGNIRELQNFIEGSVILSTRRGVAWIAATPHLHREVTDPNRDIFNRMRCSAESIASITLPLSIISEPGGARTRDHRIKRPEWPYRSRDFPDD
jgi:DNA-binding NtrC family response regulator